MRIGITERGDAGIDYSWYGKVRNGGVDGAVLITKSLSDTFCARVAGLHKEGFHIIVHCTVTGWGGTEIEPNVCNYQYTLNKLAGLVSYGFPKGQCVLRVDPVFPTESGLKRVGKVIGYVAQIGLLPIRVRVSLLDEYPHVRERFMQHGFQPIYGGKFQADSTQVSAAAECLAGLSEKYGVVFECCAEQRLVAAANGIRENTCIETGCISAADLEVMGIEGDVRGENPQKRSGCHCLSCKTELLTKKRQCPNQCLYCYWK